MKRYEEYKDSGIEWIGEIPSHWERCRFKNFIYLKSEKSTSSVKIGLENIESGTGRYITSDTEFDGDGVGFVPDDIVYGKLRPYLRKVWLAEFEGNAIGDFFVFSSLRNSIPAFVKYVMLSDGFTKESNGSTFGAKMPRVASEFILTMPFALPPLAEQEAIAGYLDGKCGAIDRVIGIQERRIGLLKELRQSVITRAVTRGIEPGVKMKDSGVEWIGEVPEKWEACRLKNVATLYGRIGFRGYNQSDIVAKGEGAITLSPSNMKGKMNYDSCTYLSWFKYHESPEIKIHNGDVLFVKTGSTYGKSALVEDLPMEATINPQIVVFKEFKCDSRFFQYVLQTPGIKFQVDNTVIGSTIPTISQEKISNYTFAIPSMSEQQEIVQYIEQKTKAIDTSIAKAERQIELLKEYKQSLVTECVTGKRKVC